MGGTLDNLESLDARDTRKEAIVCSVFSPDILAVPKSLAPLRAAKNRLVLSVTTKF